MKPCVFGFALLAASLGAGAATSPVPVDPWSQVPTLPTACYGEQDNFTELVRSRIETLSHEIERQTAVNDELGERFRTMDFTEKQRRMSEYMRQHPQESGKIMEAFQAAGTQGSNDARGAAAEEERQQVVALDGVVAQYQAAYRTAIGPINARTLAVGDGPWNGGEKKVLNAKADQEYEKLCAQWWKTGPFHTGLARYKKILVQNIPKREATAQLMVTNMTWAGVPAATFHPTAGMEAVKQYMEQALAIFGKRNATTSHVE